MTGVPLCGLALRFAPLPCLPPAPPRTSALPPLLLALSSSPSPAFFAFSPPCAPQQKACSIPISTLGGNQQPEPAWTEEAGATHSRFMELATALVEGRMDPSAYEDDTRALLGVSQQLLQKCTAVVCCAEVLRCRCWRRQ